MAGYSTTLRNTRLDAITTALGNGAKLKVYNGVRPATGGAATTLLATLTLGTPAAPASAAGVLTFNAITADPSAAATSAATWARLETSGGTFVADVSVGTAAAEFILNTTSIVAGGTVSCTSGTITAGNP